MSRALYHLSYGTADLTVGVPTKSRRSLGFRGEETLASGLYPRLQLALLLPVLVDGDALSLIHGLGHKCAGGLGSGWLRSLDSNQGPSGYEPDELPLLHSAFFSIRGNAQPSPRRGEGEGRGALRSATSAGESEGKGRYPARRIDWGSARPGRRRGAGRRDQERPLVRLGEAAHPGLFL